MVCELYPNKAITKKTEPNFLYMEKIAIFFAEYSYMKLTHGMTY